MEEIFQLIFQQYLTLYTGAFILSKYYKITGSKITYDDIIKDSSHRINTLKYKAYFTGLAFWMIVVVILVLIFPPI